ncbi:hypothetical protein G6F24_015593 [Rhizopus arrhizus]|nr:hypothetical protein G6F24_015593 [Rhizopus arrhizus]
MGLLDRPAQFLAGGRVGVAAGEARCHAHERQREVGQQRIGFSTRFELAEAEAHAGTGHALAELQQRHGVDQCVGQAHIDDQRAAGQVALVQRLQQPVGEGIALQGITWPAASTVPSAWRSRSSSWYCAVLPPATAPIG